VLAAVNGCAGLPFGAGTRIDKRAAVGTRAALTLAAVAARCRASNALGRRNRGAVLEREQALRS